MSYLRISEIFLSLQGETRTVGIPTIFIRLTGCPLRCQYCDTNYAFTGGTVISIKAIIAQVANYKVPYVTVTGGEPLAQPACLELLTNLCDQNYTVSLETNGAMDISMVDIRVSKVMDLKTPGSGVVNQNCYSNIELLTSNDQIKFVICNRQDYEWSKIKLQTYQLAKSCEVLFSPVAEILPASDLANWILRDQLPVRLQIQLHKLLWGNRPGC
ncbi:7-carboxy-7-deazaguanine synthase [Achromatium sp. WMS3]|nr:7-carboxy-7-deazaguanine synthase [Achromatium sp. WMS3]